ncbi:MAG TPA: hypothetical protein VGB92_15985 [Longimicrobium sp.]|jgi:hypothetical protein
MHAITPPYTAPVDQLLSLGSPGEIWDPWADYLALGLTDEHVPELIRMATDPALNESEGLVEVWAPLHAWRALGQLRAEAAAQPLVDLLATVDDDWVQDDLPQALGMIGGAAIAGLRELLANDAADLTPRISAMAALSAVARDHPELRDQAVGVLTAQLALWPDQDPDLNASLISALAKLQAVEAAPVMEAAFTGCAVTEYICGDWEDAQVRLGLLAERITPLRTHPPLFSLPPSISPTTSPTRPRASPKVKNRRKEARAARKRNRRK